jgi:hypothetical protein
MHCLSDAAFVWRSQSSSFGHFEQQDEEIYQSLAQMEERLCRSLKLIPVLFIHYLCCHHQSSAPVVSITCINTHDNVVPPKCSRQSIFPPKLTRQNAPFLVSCGGGQHHLAVLSPSKYSALKLTTELSSLSPNPSESSIRSELKRFLQEIQ